MELTMQRANYTDKENWDKHFKGYNLRKIDSILFDDLFPEYLNHNPKLTCLEVGCAGGEFLCYLTKAYAYKPYGVDFSDAIEITKRLFVYNSLPEPTLYQKDFFQWDPVERFDIVCSFGFIEHFEDMEKVIAAHARLLKPGGLLIVTMPNMARLQYIFHWLIDRENLAKHNTKIMNLRAIRNALKGLNFEIKHLNYYRTFGFWTARKEMKTWERVVNWIISFCGRAIIKIFGKNRPNSMLSPHIVCIARSIAPTPQP
jgi:2-polyprenyl-3-methyl-5-hydroxy-6-metoxy-1,4-benzoquinol methylase